MSLRNFVSIVLAIALLLANAVVLVSASKPEAEKPQAPMRFGMDAGSMDRQSDAGVTPDYGTFWVGPWTLESGWGGPGKSMAAMRDKGVTPAIHFYYWGDDISPSCVENGCWSDLHNTHKNRAGWERLAQELVDNLNKHMEGEPVLVFMETEFNQNGITEHEPFDGHLANLTNFIKDGYPAAQTVMALGNWMRSSWSTFNMSAEASDYIGIQGMRGSTRDSLSNYRSIYEDTVHAVEHMQAIFGKPIIILDIALSSYPEPDYLRYQAETLENFFIGKDRLQQAGVEAMIYRAWQDHPGKDVNNYYGTAERHWGLKWSSSSDLKPSGEVWVAGVQSARSGEDYESPLSSERGFEASFNLSKNIGEWWVETYAAGSNPLARVDARVGEGSWRTLDYTDWGAWAKSFHAPEGSAMVLRATDSQGNSASTFPFAWMQEKPQIDDSANRPASAAFSTETENLWVSLNASESHDPYDRDLSFEWDFGDGTGAEGQHVDHTYNRSGDYYVTMIVDNGDITNSTTQTVSVQAPPPRASISNTTDGGLRVWLDASGSSDPLDRELNHTWDLGDGDVANGEQVNHTYPRSGDYTVSLTVNNGESTNTTMTRLTLHAPPPNAGFNTTTTGLLLTFDGSGSRDEYDRGLEYAWDLGDGTQKAGSQGEHTYARSGNYTVMLTVDNGEKTANQTKNIQVEAPPPAARFTSEIDNLTVRLDGSGSDDPLGRNLTYGWELGDGTRRTGSIIDHTYTKSGTYTVKLTVDNGEHTAQETQNISVTAPPPEARFTSEIDNLTVRLDASGSHDPLGRNLTYGWELGDGSRKSGRQTEHTYDQSGNYTVVLTADNGEETADHTKNISVTAPLPQARFTSEIDNLTVRLDGSGSHDPLGRNLTYGWDLGDGTKATGRQVHHNYTADGVYDVTLVVDNGDKNATYSQQLSVQRPSDELQATFTRASGSNEWWVEVYVDANNPLTKVEAQIDGNPWRTLEKKDWGSWAASLKAPKGSEVILRATDEHGQQVNSPTYLWLQGEKNESQEPEEPQDPEPLNAKFTRASGSHGWWVEVYVDANHPLTKVEAKIDGNPWRTLEKKDWGSWAASLKAPEGSEVVFRATDGHGQRVVSDSFTW